MEVCTCACICILLQYKAGKGLSFFVPPKKHKGYRDRSDRILLFAHLRGRTMPGKPEAGKKRTVEGIKEMGVRERGYI